MSTVLQQVAVAVRPVFAVSLSITVLHAAGLGFPPAMSLQAWAHWMIFCALVFGAMALLQGAAGLVARLRARRRPQTAA